MFRSAACAAIFLAGLSGLSLAAEPPTYSVTVVPPPAPYTQFDAEGVNNLGHFFGLASGGQGSAYVFWTPERVVILTNPPFGYLLSISAINDADELLIQTDVGPAIWSLANGWRRLETLHDRDTTWANAFNNADEAVGTAYDGYIGNLHDTTRQAVAWHADGTIRVLSKQVGEGTGINSRGDITLTVYQPSGTGNEEAFEGVLDPIDGPPVLLGELPHAQAPRRSTAIGVSDDGVVAMASAAPGTRFLVACTWSREAGIQPVGKKWPSAGAVAISRTGTMIGYADPQGDPFAWNAAWGPIRLMTHLAPGSPAFQTFDVYGINDAGVIAAAGVTVASRNAVLLTPINH